MKFHSSELSETTTMNSRGFARYSCMAIIICCCFLIIACGVSELEDSIDAFTQEPDGEPIRATLKTAVPLAHIAAVSMAAFDGHTFDNVTTIRTCPTYPCPGWVYMDLDPLNLPFAADTSGTVVVAGLWASRDSAILTVFFVDSYAGVPTFPVRKISTFPVAASGSSGYTIVYADIDINIAAEPDDEIVLTQEEIDAEYERLDEPVSDDVAVNLSMDAWVIELDLGGTPYIFTDDRYTISGGGQYVGVVSSSTTSSVNIMQIGMANTLVSYDCARNPTEGMALINEVAAGGSGSFPVVATALIGFDSVCNGRANVIVATGNYIAANGGTIALDLDLP